MIINPINISQYISSGNYITDMVINEIINNPNWFEKRISAPE